MSDPSFWENGDHAKEISQKATEAKAAYDTYTAFLHVQRA